MSMKNIILCEGIDDVYILGYYLFKTASWRITSKDSLSELYKLSKKKSRNEEIKIYEKEDDLLAIWGVGGKDSFEKAFKAISNINNIHPTEGISKVFIISDRDQYEVEDCLITLKEKLIANGINSPILINNSLNIITYNIDGNNYILEIIPIIIPFEYEGALETVLMNAIKEDGAEEKYIVEKAINYIDSYISDYSSQTYLKKDRLVLKAKFSSVISITNPDRSTALFDKLLMTHKWEDKEEVQKHFEILNSLL